MKNNLLEKLNKKIDIDSIYLQSNDEFLSNLHVRFIEDSEKNSELYFYEVLEYTCLRSIKNENQLVEIETSDWINQFIKLNSDYQVDYNASEYHHYRLYVDEMLIDILAVGYSIKSKFNEKFRKQAIVKTLVQ